VETIKDVLRIGKTRMKMVHVGFSCKRRNANLAARKERFTL